MLCWVWNRVDPDLLLHFVPRENGARAAQVKLEIFSEKENVDQLDWAMESLKVKQHVSVSITLLSVLLTRAIPGLQGALSFFASLPHSKSVLSFLRLTFLWDEYMECR